MGKTRAAPKGIFGSTITNAKAASGSSRNPRQRCDCRRVVRLSFHIWLGLLLAMQVGSATAAAVPEALTQIASGEGSMRVIVQPQGNAVPEWQLASDEQPAPAQGPGPIPPGTGPQAPPEAPPSPGEATEVPIGRMKGYEEEKKKALEIPFRGSPPGAIQEDTGVSPRRTKTGSCEGR